MFAVIADLHLGVKLKNEDFMKSLNTFFELIKSQKEECTDIFVAGDLFDHRLTIDEHKFASLFLLNLVCNGCGRNGRIHVPVHFVHGTYNHDYEQYQIYLPILEKIDGVEVDYIDHVCAKKLRNGKMVLYLPQEYGNVDYDPYFDKKNHYDIIIGHGPVSSATKNPCRSASNEILHSAELLGELSDVCVFGHYHGYTDFGNQVFYAGPWLRWQYGQDEERVFMFVNDDHTVTTIKNEIALEYKTIAISSPEQLRDEISKGIETPHRFVFTPETEEDMNTYRSIMTVNVRNTNIKYVINTKEEEEIQQQQEVEEVKQSSNGIEPIDSLISYISDNYGIDATKEIRDYESKINKES